MWAGCNDTDESGASKNGDEPNEKTSPLTESVLRSVGHTSSVGSMGQNSKRKSSTSGLTLDEERFEDDARNYFATGAEMWGGCESDSDDAAEKVETCNKSDDILQTIPLNHLDTLSKVTASKDDIVTSETSGIAGLVAQAEAIESESQSEACERGEQNKSPSVSEGSQCEDDEVLREAKRQASIDRKVRLDIERAVENTTKFLEQRKRAAEREESRSSGPKKDSSSDNLLDISGTKVERHRIYSDKSASDQRKSLKSQENESQRRQNGLCRRPIGTTDKSPATVRKPIMSRLVEEKRFWRQTSDAAGLLAESGPVQGRKKQRDQDKRSRDKRILTAENLVEESNEQRTDDEDNITDVTDEEVARKRNMIYKNRVFTPVDPRLSKQTVSTNATEPPTVPHYGSAGGHHINIPASHGYQNPQCTIFNNPYGPAVAFSGSVSNNVTMANGTPLVAATTQHPYHVVTPPATVYGVSPVGIHQQVVPNFIQQQPSSGTHQIHHLHGATPVSASSYVTPSSIGPIVEETVMSTQTANISHRPNGAIPGRDRTSRTSTSDNMNMQFQGGTSDQHIENAVRLTRMLAGDDDNNVLGGLSIEELGVVARDCAKAAVTLQRVVQLQQEKMFEAVRFLGK